VSHFRDAYDEFRRLNAQVASVSVDSPFAHRAWAKELNIPFPMISDFAHDLLTKYEALTGNVPLLGAMGGYHAFLIGADCTLKGVWYQPETGGLSPVDQVLETVRGDGG
jgi:peroxiredoxin (alkyl hydroperoxide reductase subunit C)